MSTATPLPLALRAVDDETAPPDERGRAFWRVLAVVSVLATVVLYWHISQTAVAPRTPWDENHLLQMGRLLSGDDNVAKLAGSGYYPGWAVVIAPIWWFTHDAATVYAAAVTLSNVIGVATIVPLARLGRYLGLTWAQGVTLGAAVMILPARSVMADYALSEQLVTFLLAWSVVAAFALWRNPTWLRVILFVAAVGATYLTHPRAIALVGTSAIWLLALAIRRWRLAVLGLALLAAAYVGVGRAANALGDRVLLNGYGKGDILATTLERFEPRVFAKVFLNQTWVQVVGTAGLFAIAVVLLVVWTVRELRTRRLGTGAFLLGLIVSTMLVSAIWWNRPDILMNEGYPRLDAWTYSRYIDPVSGILVMVALAALVRGLRAGVAAVAAGVFALGAAAVVLLVAPNVPLWGVISPSNATILPWVGMFPEEPFDRPLVPTFTNEARFWVWASVFALGCLVVHVALRRWSRVLATVVLALASVLALLANPAQIRPAPEQVAAAVEEIESVALDGQLADIDFDLACEARGTYNQAINWYPFWLSPRDVEIVDRRLGEEFDSDLVISCASWEWADWFGARAYDGEPDLGYRLWVLPGALQDELDAAGLLR